MHTHVPMYALALAVGNKYFHLLFIENAINGSSAVSGYCDEQCKNFIFFIVLFSFFVFMHSTSEVGSMLLIMRCTDPKGTVYLHICTSTLYL